MEQAKKQKSRIQTLSKTVARISAGLLIILSMNHAAGERILSIGLGTTEIHTMLLGLVFVFVFVAHVMEEAHELSEENNQFI